jgi:hypothetical protein
MAPQANHPLANTLKFLDESGKKIHAPQECLPSPPEKWAEAFVAPVPQLALTRD